MYLNNFKSKLKCCGNEQGDAKLIGSKGSIRVLKNNLTVIRGEMQGIMGGRGEGFQKQL